MREIKFRAWDGFRILKENEIHKIEFYKNGTWAIIGMEIFNGVDNLKREYKISKSYDKDNKSILMQYTGLKDKNGVEIYEGDIVKSYHSKSKFYEDIAKIEFYHGSFVVASVDFEDDRHEPLPKNEWQSIEVIGNIYENLELLKDN